jgi:hypothetical protein
MLWFGENSTADLVDSGEGRLVQECFLAPVSFLIQRGTCWGETAVVKMASEAGMYVFQI